MEHAADEGDAEIGIEVRAVVPAEGGDAVAGRDAEVQEDAGEAPAADGEVGEGVALERRIGGTPVDLASAAERLRAAEDGREREGVVHHQTVHDGGF